MPKQKYEESEFYSVDGGFLLALIEMQKRLYSQASLSGDERRDMANFLNAAIVQGQRVEGPIDLG
jgi:hypothetical protein